VSRPSSNSRGRIPATTVKTAAEKELDQALANAVDQDDLQEARRALAAARMTHPCPDNQAGRLIGTAGKTLLETADAHPQCPESQQPTLFSIPKVVRTTG
jgi:hypothetical protein